MVSAAGKRVVKVQAEWNVEADLLCVCVCAQEGGLPSAQEHLPPSGLQAVSGGSAAAGAGVRIRRGAHPSAPGGVRLPQR